MYHLGRFVIWLRQQGIEEQVKQAVEDSGKDWLRELECALYVSSDSKRITNRKAGSCR